MALTNFSKPRPLAKMQETRVALKREPAKLLNVPMESSSLRNKYYQKYIASQKGLVWIDPSDLQMLQRKFEVDQQYFKSPLKRWMSIAWDSFRVIDNNSCSVIFT